MIGFSLIGIVSYVAYQILSVDYSETPDLALRKFEKAILVKDEEKLRNLFVSGRGYDACMSIPINSEGSRQSKTPLKRSEGQMGIEAWQIWFKSYGRTFLRFRALSPEVGAFSPPDEYAFSIYTQYTPQGYLIRDCAFSL